MDQFYAQNGEDKALAEIFSSVNGGTCCEVGAHDGIHFSNTYYFEQAGWRCILVEPNSTLCDEIRRSRKASVFECAASERCGTATLYLGSGSQDVYSSLQPAKLPGGRKYYREVAVTTNTLDAMLRESRAESLDFITIDVEGHEIEALRRLTLSRWNPCIVLLEDNSDMLDAQADAYMRTAGYIRFWRSGANDSYAAQNIGRIRVLCQIARSGCFSWKALVKGTLPKAWTRRILVIKRKAASSLSNFRTKG